MLRFILYSIFLAIPSMLLADDIECLAKNIYYESRGEPLQGQLMVAQVTINRLFDDRYPNTICDVVWQPDQFSWTLNSDRFIEDFNAWRTSYIIAKAVISRNGYINSVFRDADHFHSINIPEPVWASKMKYLGRVGNHKFYKWE